MSDKIKAVPNVEAGTKPLTQAEMLAAIAAAQAAVNALLNDARKQGILTSPITAEVEGKIDSIKSRALELDECPHCIAHQHDREQCNEELTALYKSLPSHVAQCDTCNGKTKAGDDKSHKIVFKTPESKDKYRQMYQNRQAAEKRLASGK